MNSMNENSKTGEGKYYHVLKREFTDDTFMLFNRNGYVFECFYLDGHIHVSICRRFQFKTLLPIEWVSVIRIPVVDCSSYDKMYVRVNQWFDDTINFDELCKKYGVKTKLWT